VDWSDRLHPWRHGGCATTNCWFGRGLCETFAAYMSGRQHASPDKVNISSFGTATSTGIVKSCVSWLDQERLYHKWSPMHSKPWFCKHWISVWVHRWFLGWILLYSSDSTPCVNFLLMSASWPQRSPFHCSYTVVPLLWVENESTSDSLAIWYCCMYLIEAQSQNSKVCRFSGVFYNERYCFVHVTWYQDSSGWWRCV